MSAVLQNVTRVKLAWLGFALIFTPFYFVTAAILKYGLGVGLFFDPLAAFFADPQRLRFLNLVLTPVLFFGGSIVAVALNLYAMLRPSRDNRPGHRGLNLVVVLVAFSLLLVMTTYGYLENFTRR